MANIAAIVVTYNRKVLLRECLQALLNQESTEMDIILIDNCSTDGTQEYISDILQNDHVKLYRTETNIGGAGGFNYGMKIAVSLGYDYLWLMDDDSIPEKKALQSIWKAHLLLEGKYGFLCSNVK